MKANINEIEIQFSETEKKTIETISEITEHELPNYDGFYQPATIIKMLGKANQALRLMENPRHGEGKTKTDRIELLRFRKDLKELCGGIEKAESKFDNAY